MLITTHGTIPSRRKRLRWFMYVTVKPFAAIETRAAFCFRGGDRMDIVIITTGLENAIRNVKDVGRSLTWHVENNGVAVASVGNCLIGLWSRTENTTRMDIEVFRTFKVGRFFVRQRDDVAREMLDDIFRELRANGLIQWYPYLKRVANETLARLRNNPAEEATAEHQAELAKLANITADQAATVYYAQFGEVGKPTANQAEQEQAGTRSHRESKRNRIFGLHAGFLIVGIVLGIFISLASWYIFPDWSRSNLTFVILFPFAFAVATNFVANFRKAYE